MQTQTRGPSALPPAPESTRDERLLRAAEYMSTQLNVPVAQRIIHELTDLLKTNPREGKACYFLGVAHEFLANRHIGWDRRQRQKARRYYRQALQSLAPGSFFANAAVFSLAASLAWRGRLEEVRKLLTPMLQSTDSRVRMRADIIVGAAAFRAGRVEEALQHWHRAEALTPEGVSNYDPSLPGAWLTWGYRFQIDKCLRQRKLEESYRYSRKLLSMDEIFLTAQDYRRHSVLCKKMGRTEESLEALDTALVLSAGTEDTTPDLRMGEPCYMPLWGYAYDKAYDDSGSIENDLLK